MSRLACLASLVGLLVACNSGIGVTDASGVGSTGTSNPTSATGPTSSTGLTTTGSTGAPTTGAEGTAGLTGTAGTTTATTNTTGAVDTTTGQTTTATTTTGLTTAASTGGDSTTGAPVGCVDVSGDYGGCEAELGYGFDGTICRLFSGCDCAPNCEHFAPDPVGCASACAAAGHCEEDKIQGAGIEKGPAQVGDFCDSVDACASAGTPAFEWLKELFPGSQCEPSQWCGGGEGCSVQDPDVLDAAEWMQLCAASLLPDAELYCVVFGP